MSRIPIATYRLQLHAQFGFDDAAAIADYLHELGVSHVYSSPYLQAAPGSTHGYDVVDHHRVNEELGGAEAHERFCRRLGECGLGQVLDIVPNHMAISGRRNRLWWDVWENGPSSRYSPYFDINWNPRDEKLRNKLLIPVLGDHYGRVLSRGEIQLKRRGAEFLVTYFDNEFPMSPRSLPPILCEAAKETGSDYLAFLAESLKRLPIYSSTDQESKHVRHRDKTIVYKLLETLLSETPFIAEAIDHALADVNRDMEKLDAVLENQNFRLAFWHTARQELPYRRFFDVNSLVALNMEIPQVFADTHALILRWLREGVLDGIRIDHPDGLRDPRGYFERLREQAQDVWIIAEKILEPGETFRSDWPIDGTTGYDFLNETAGLFVDTRNEEQFNRIYTAFTQESTDYVAACRDKKHRVLRDLLGSDVNRLTHLLTEICELHRDQRDYTRHDIMRAIRELVACFPVYRTYVVPERDEITPEDERYINEAIEAAKNYRPGLDAGLFDFMRDILLLRVRGPLETEFVMRFQQFCGPAMAKGVEDTVFYCFDRLVSLNEVGGDPGRFGIPAEDFHRYCAEVQRTHPRTMLASSTHDTKRSEDVRARISLLSEMPEEWRQVLSRWAAANEKHKTGELPDRNTEYFLYQTLIGAWPISLDRMRAYMEKAMREAKQRTSWLAPNEPYENALKSFIGSLYEDQAFVADLEAFVAKLVEPGRINSLAQMLLKLTAPGIPDTYQGQELWDLSLVDPDNRRPVDYDLRRKLLCEIKRLSVDEIWSRADEGLPKMWTLHRTLKARREKPEAFDSDAGYRPLPARGAKADHLLAFARGEKAVTAVPRLVWQLQGKWEDTTLELPTGNWRNVLTDERVEARDIAAAQLFRSFPVALLISD
ncbi:MAG TPA: malto-oligosyltrehalose synthase [Bryobacteraceae bacterium]|jgi:(1->4)-alpha-D-glucan 1-alpha-D-glucosylmutase|nr:malto-oligosyltrehalose synthase [Bryobacteraceae bacterium]